MIRIRELTWTAPGSTADPRLSVPTLDIRRNEYVGITGPNGAGKSLLLQMIGGLRPPTAGSVTFDDTNGSKAPRPGYLFQNPSDQLLGSTVERDLAFGLENAAVAPVEIRRRVDEALERHGLVELARRPPHLLSEGEKQRVAFASVLILDPEVLLVDEPTARLDAPDRAEFLQRLREAHRGGATVLHVTHRPEELALATRVIALREGRVAFDGPPGDLSPGDAERCGVLSAPGPSGLSGLSGPSGLSGLSGPSGLSGKPGLTAAAPPAARAEGLRPLVRLHDVHWASDDGAGPVRPVLRGVDLEVFPGERVGVTGRSGAGKTTLAAILAGLMPPAAGEVEHARPSRRAGAVRVPVALAFQEPERGFFEETVERDVAFGPANLGLPEDGARAKARTALERVGLPPDAFGPRAPETLSGGEARRAGIAGLLALESDLVVLDEPTTGLDAEGVARLRDILAGLRRDGTALLLVSHETALLRAECDRVLELVEGRLSPYAGS